MISATVTTTNVKHSFSDEPTVEYVSNQKGNINLVVNGYSYFSHALPNRNIRWRCRSYNHTKCPAAVVENKVTKKLRLTNLTHNHGESELGPLVAINVFFISIDNVTPKRKRKRRKIKK